jgi:hypothetical protein
MKNLISFTLLLSSFAAYSTVELHSKIDNVDCLITKSKVIRSVTFNDKKMGFTTTKAFSGYGYEEMAKKAATASTGRTVMDGMYMEVIIDGVASKIHVDDSVESESLIYFISNACK